MATHGYDGEIGMSGTEMFQYLVDKVYEIFQKNLVDGRTIIKKDDFDKDVPGVDETPSESKVVFYTTDAAFGDSYGGIVLCCSTEGFPEEESDRTIAVSMVSISDMKNPGAGYKVLLDDIFIDRQSLEMTAALLQYISVMTLLQGR